MKGTPWHFRPDDWADGGDLLVQVDTRSFRKFSRQMDRRLTKLVEEWAHAAAPNALRPRRRHAPKPKPK